MAVASTPPSLSPEDASLEQYLLAVLSDSNLPTGGFVASSGLEAWIQHGFLTPSLPVHPHSSTPAPPGAPAPLLAFISHSLHSYARLNAPLLRAAHAAVWSLRSPLHSISSPPALSARVDDAVKSVFAADTLCDSLTLNHIARRASVAQGAAFLTLYERAFAPAQTGRDSGEGEVGELVKRFRAAVRRTLNPAREGKGPVGEGERAYGHMTVAFAVLAAGVGLCIDAALPLYLFLHARSLLSSAVRLNTLGPYAAHRLLLWDVRPLVDAAVATVALPPLEAETVTAAKEEMGDGGEEKADWWDDDPFWRPLWEDDPLCVAEAEKGAIGSGVGRGKGAVPVTTWPLGEIIASRHDQLFTKVFNS